MGNNEIEIYVDASLSGIRACWKQWTYAVGILKEIGHNVPIAYLEMYKYETDL